MGEADPARCTARDQGGGAVPDRPVHPAPVARARFRSTSCSPPGFLNTGIWESWHRNRTRYRLRRYRPQQTLDAVLGRFETAGVKVAFTPLEQVAAQVVDGLRSGSFWMMGPSAASDEMALQKARSIVERRPPDYLVDVLSKSAQTQDSENRRRLMCLSPRRPPAGRADLNTASRQQGAHLAGGGDGHLPDRSRDRGSRPARPARAGRRTDREGLLTAGRHRRAASVRVSGLLGGGPPW